VTRTIRHLHERDRDRATTADKLRNLDRDGIAALRQHYWNMVDDHFGCGISPRIFVDKFTMNTIDVAFINTIFPDARLVFVQRDPRDVCLSCFQQLMVPSLTTVQLSHWNNIARFYAQVMDWWFHVRPMLTMTVHELRYEDAVADSEATFRRLLEFSGLEWDSRVLEFHRRAEGRFIASPSRNQVAQPLYSTSAGRWRYYAREYGPVIATLTPLIDELRYPPFATA
jgi:hypothetical protein